MTKALDAADEAGPECMPYPFVLGWLLGYIDDRAKREEISRRLERSAQS